MNIIFVAVHPDDETLAFGGTILDHKHRGDNINLLIITNISVKDGYDKVVVENRQKEIVKVKELYGFDNIYKLDFPTTKLDTIPLNSLIGSISDVFKIVKPEIVYLPNRSDVHSDHKIAFQASYSCTKNFRYPFIKRILMGETLSETEFAAPSVENLFVSNVYINITEHFEKKIEIFKIYKSELMDDNLPRSIAAIESLARYRGSRIGVRYAESFQLLFERL